MNIIFLYTIIAIASAMGIVVAFLTGNTMAAGWALGVRSGYVQKVVTRNIISEYSMTYVGYNLRF